MATDEKDKLAAEEWTRTPTPMVQEGVGAKVSERHPREQLIEDLNDQEQRLLDKLVAIRQIRDEYRYLLREEAERLVKIARLADILRY